MSNQHATADVGLLWGPVRKTCLLCGMPIWQQGKVLRFTSPEGEFSEEELNDLPADLVGRLRRVYKPNWLHVDQVYGTAKPGWKRCEDGHGEATLGGRS